MSPKVSQEHKEQRRTELLTAAKTVFIKNGYERTTMKHVMDEAKVSRGGLYQYFSNKEDLYEAILEEQLKQANEAQLQSLTEQNESYWDMLLSLFLGKEKQANDKMDPLAPTNLEFFITGRNDERRRKYAETRYNDANRLFNKVIQSGIKAGEFKPRFDSSVIARSIITYTDGLALQHSILSSKDIQLKIQTDLLLEYVKWALGLTEIE